MNAAEWYRRNYPKGPDHDPRCLRVLASWKALYNIVRTGRGRTDGGFRACGDGVEVHIPPGHGRFSTYDDGGLTRLVVAAHRYACRVEIATEGRHTVLRVHPRSHDGTRFYDRHPRPSDLSEQVMAP